MKAQAENEAEMLATHHWKVWVDIDGGEDLAAYAYTEENALERARRAAAGWNLLETLEEMEALALLDRVRNGLVSEGFQLHASDVAAISAAIRTALESKP